MSKHSLHGGARFDAGRTIIVGLGCAMCAVACREQAPQTSPAPSFTSMSLPSTLPSSAPSAESIEGLWEPPGDPGPPTKFLVKKEDVKKGRLQSLDEALDMSAKRGNFTLGVKILGGTETNDTWNSVGLLTVDGRMQCTGLALTKRAVVTAAHCVSSGRLEMFFGSDGRDPKARTPLIPVRNPPSTNGLFDKANPRHDVAVLCLERDATPSGLSLASRTAPPPLKGRTVHLVGYGFASPGGRGTLGVRREVDVSVTDDVDGTFFYGDSHRNTCNGDSGGPAILDGKWFVGVTSFNTDGRCADRSVDARIDDSFDYVKDAIAKCQQ